MFAFVFYSEKKKQLRTSIANKTGKCVVQLCQPLRSLRCQKDAESECLFYGELGDLRLIVKQPYTFSFSSSSRMGGKLGDDIGWGLLEIFYSTSEELVLSNFTLLAMNLEICWISSEKPTEKKNARNHR